MKKLLFSVFLLAVVSFQSYPQNTIKAPDGFSGPDKYFEKLLNPCPSGIPGLTLPAEMVSKRIYKSMDTKGTGYRPVKVISDTVHKDTYSYDASGNLSAVLTENLINGVWVEWSRFTYTYDSNGNTLTAHMETYNNGMVKDTYDEKYSYNTGGKLLSTVIVSKMYGVFQSSFRATYTYAPDGSLASMLYETGTSEGTWGNDMRFTYTYDTKGNVLTNFLESWQNGTWNNSFRVAYTYDLNGNITATLGEIWKDSLWAKGSTGSYTYDEKGNLLSRQFESWDGTRLVIKDRWTYSYDVNGNMVLSLVDQWVNNDWANYRKGIFTYDDHGNAVKGESFEWSSEAKWVPSNDGISMNYNYGRNHLEASGPVVEVEYATSTAGLSDNPSAVNEYSLSQNYPNPFNPSTTINYSLKKEGNVKLTVFDALGKRVAVIVNEFRPSGSYTVKFDGSSLPSGIYICRLEAGEFTAARKIILLK